MVVAEVPLAALGRAELRDEVRRLREAVALTEQGIERIAAEVESSRELMERGRDHNARERIQLEVELQALDDENKRLQAEANETWFSARRSQAAVRQLRERHREELGDLELRRRGCAQENARMRREATAMRARVRSSVQVWQAHTEAVTSAAGLEDKLCSLLLCTSGARSPTGSAAGRGTPAGGGAGGWLYELPAASPSTCSSSRGAVRRSHSLDGFDCFDQAEQACGTSRGGGSSLDHYALGRFGGQQREGVTSSSRGAVPAAPVIPPKPAAAVAAPSAASSEIVRPPGVADLLGEAELQMQQQMEDLRSQLEQVRALRRVAEGGGNAVFPAALGATATCSASIGSVRGGAAVATDWRGSSRSLTPRTTAAELQSVPPPEVDVAAVCGPEATPIGVTSLPREAGGASTGTSQAAEDTDLLTMP